MNQTAKQSNPTACLIVIGNEILSGRTQDKNVAWLARELNEAGVKLAEVRVIPDIEEKIVETVNTCRTQFTYIFTTGGIGPTHDDITSGSIARAFGVKLVRNPQAEVILERHYGREQLNPARLKMAEIPEGASLILNPVSAAPGFALENVYVMAGVPSIMQAMFAHIKPLLKGGAKTHALYVAAYITEGLIAEGLTAIQAQYDNVDIGSYPFIRNNRLGTTLVARSTDTAALAQAAAQIKALLLSFTAEVFDEDLAA